MPFTPKTWQDVEDGTTTPLDADALVDVETRLSDYTDQEVTSEAAARAAGDTAAASAAAAALAAHDGDTTGVHGIPDTSALVVTTDGRLTNARPPTGHAATHKAGGSDQLRIDELAAPAGPVDLNTHRLTGLANPASASDAIRNDDARLTDARTPTAHTHPQTDITGLATALAALLPKAGGTMTGALTLAGDPVGALDAASRQWVLTQIAALINGAPGALDTLGELAAQLANDETAATALAGQVAGKLAASQNLADLVSAATARTNLGLGTAATRPATDFDTAGAAAAAQAAAIAASQPVDSDLTAIAALTTTAFGRALLTQADAAATRSTLGLGTAATSSAGAFDPAGAAASAAAASQPVDSDLTAIAALTTTAYGRAFLALTDAAAARTALGLGSAALAAASDFAPAGATSAPTIVNAGGNQGATASWTVPANTEVWRHNAILNADLTLTLAIGAGGRLKLFGSQDTTGGRKLTVSDGTNSQPVSIATTGGATFEVDFYSPDGSTIIINAGAAAGAPGPQGLQGSVGATGPQGPAGAAGSSAGFPNLVAPPGFNFSLLGTVGTTTAQVPRGMRVRAQKTGTLHDLIAYIGTQSGNYAIAVYDTGDASAGNRTLLYASGPLACPAGGAWQILADPAIAVTAGQELDLLLAFDNSTATAVRGNNIVGAAAGYQLPASFAAAGGGLPKMWFTGPTLTSLAFPSTISEAAMTPQTSAFVLLGRVS